MVSTTQRRFTDEFKRETVALWETSGRMQTEVAAELGIMPTMLRRWQRKLQESSVSPISPAAKPPVSTMASPADQASEIARLRRELDRARMQRDILEHRAFNWTHSRQRRSSCDTRLGHTGRRWNRRLSRGRRWFWHRSDGDGPSVWRRPSRWG